MAAVGETLRILLVEDDPGDVMIIQEALSALPCYRQVSVVGDGREAWEFLNRDGVHRQAPRPDMVLLDLNMPRMDGRELLVLLKSDLSLRTIPVVVLTTSSAEEDILSSYERHANAFVTKPVGYDELVAAVHQIDAFFTRLAALPVRRHVRQDRKT